MSLTSAGASPSLSASTSDRGSGRTRSSSKRSLLALSHAMERSMAVGTSQAQVGRLMVGLFQHKAYFDAERERYAALAAGGCVCIVGFVGPVDDLPPGVWGASLPMDHALAGEWTLMVLDGAVGMALVAQDALDVAPYEATLEAGRLFRARWTFHRDDALADAARLVQDLASMLPLDAVTIAEAVIREVSAIPTSQAESRLASVTEYLVDSIDQAQQRTLRLRAELDATRVLAERDPLTGLYNRRYLDRFLGGPPAAAPVTVAAMLVDIDHLKAINDEHGHGAGDAAILTVTDALRASTRPNDVVARLGGDEFVVLLPGLTAEAALVVADRIVAAVRDAPHPWGDVALGVSVGVAPATSTDVPVDRLDSALYDVKRSGRGAARLAVTP